MYYLLPRLPFWVIEGVPPAQINKGVRLISSALGKYFLSFFQKPMLHIKEYFLFYGLSVLSSALVTVLPGI